MRRSSCVTPRGARRISRNRRWLRGFWRNSSSISHRLRTTARMVPARTPRICGFCCSSTNSSSSAEGWRAEHVLVDRLEIVVADLEARIERLRRLIVAEDRLAEQLQQQLVEQRHVDDGAVVALHQLLDRERVGGVFVAEAARELDLIVEQQPVFVPAGQHMQAEAHLPQECLRLRQPAQFRRRQKAVGDQLIERFGAEMALRNPGDGLHVAQAAGAGLDVRLEIVGGIVGLQAPLLLLAHLGFEELAHRPDAIGRERDAHLGQQLGGAREPPRFHQRRHDADVGGALLGAFGHGAHAVADLEPDVPQERDQPLDAGALRVRQRRGHQHQEIDVGAGMQLTAAIAAHRHQRQTLGQVRHPAAAATASAAARR